MIAPVVESRKFEKRMAESPRRSALKTFLVTGGAGFIGSNFVLKLRRANHGRVVNLDMLTYAGNMKSLEVLNNDKDHIFVRGDIGDREVVGKILAEYKPDAIINFAAESHVDRSIEGPEAFIQTNVVGTFHLIDEVKRYWSALPEPAKSGFRFLHVSTDEVYGSLGREDPAFTEKNTYEPNSPYAASKASSDHLVYSYHKTYGVPVVITNCSNNYGPFQFPEKLIPLVIMNAMNGKALPIYGDGKNIRDWLYVEDHCDGILAVAEKGRPGQSYNIGGNCEWENIEIVKAICGILDEKLPESKFRPHAGLMKFVKDRPGHDRRYAINAGKIKNELGWEPKETFASGIRKTINWYLENQEWVQSTQSEEYRKWMDLNYGNRDQGKKK